MESANLNDSLSLEWGLEAVEDGVLKWTQECQLYPKSLLKNYKENN